MSNIGQTGCESCFLHLLERALARSLWVNCLPLRSSQQKCWPIPVNPQKRGYKMDTGTKDEVKGTAHEVKGAIKATTGKVTGDSKLEAEGHVEKAAGKVQKKIGEVEKLIDK